MTGTDSPSVTDRTASLVRADPGLAEGRSRFVLFVGMGGVGIGHMVEMAPVVWAGSTLLCFAFALNTLGKLVHYGELPISSRDRVVLSATWLLLAASVLGALGTFVVSRYGPGQGGFFWPLAVASFGFSLLHMAAQSTYLPEDEVKTDT